MYDTLRILREVNNTEIRSINVLAINWGPRPEYEMFRRKAQWTRGVICFGSLSCIRYEAVMAYFVPKLEE